MENIILLTLSSIENNAAIIDSITCAGQAHGESLIIVSSLVLSSLVGNVSNISAMCCLDTPHSHDLGEIRNVANRLTGFMAGSHVG